MSNNGSEFEPVVELANEYLERHRRGEQPSVSEYANKHPDLAEQIREVFPLMLLMEDCAHESSETGDAVELEQAGPHIEKLGDFRIIREIGRGGMGVVYEALQQSLGRRVALKVFPMHSHLSPRHKERFRRESRAAAMLHHTNIVPVFAVGDEQGMLYYAMQYIRGAGLDEVIAEIGRLNPSPKTGTVRTSPHTRRDHAVSRVAQSLLTQPNGEASKTQPDRPTSEDRTDPSESSAKADSIPFPQTPPAAAESSSGDFNGSADSAVSLPGQSNDSSRSDSSKQYWRSVALIGVQVAEALEYAHGQGTLHRDIKPSNLLLDQHATVWVTDFGLAKSIEQEDLTQTGELIGTLRYMPPEQFSGHSDERSDIYGLGLSLYEMLTLRPAFDQSGREQLIHAIAAEEPTRPRKVNDRIPRDLETIVLKTIEREPARRYQNARELAADLNRFLNNEPLRARPVSATERLVKWTKRRPAVASLTAVLVLVAVSAFVLVTRNWREAERQRAAAENALRLLHGSQEREIAERLRAFEAEKDKRTAEANADSLRAVRYHSRIGRTLEHFRSNEILQARRALEQCIPLPGERDYRGWEWGYLHGQLHAELRSLSAGSAEAPWINAVAFSADGRRLVTSSVATTFRHATSGVHGKVCIWDTQTGDLVTEITDPDLRSVYAAALSSDGSRLATGDCDRIGGAKFQLRIWDVESGALIHSTESGSAITYLQFSPDDSLLAANAWNSVRVWSSTLKAMYVVPGNGFAFSDDGERLTVSGNGGAGRITVYDADTGEIRQEKHLATPGQPDPTGKYFARIVDKSAVHVYNAGTGKIAHVLRHDARIWAFAFRPDGRQIATTGGDNAVRLWELPSGRPITVFRGHTNHVISVAFDPRGHQLVSGDWNGEVKFWDVTRHPNHLVVFDPLPGHATIEAMAFDPKEARLFGLWQNYNSHMQLMIADARTGLPVSSPKRLDLTNRITVPGRVAVFNQQATRLVGVAQSNRKTLKIWDVETGNELGEFVGHTAPIHRTAIAADGCRVASASNANAIEAAGEIKVWSAEQGDILLSLRGERLNATGISLGPGGQLVAIGGASSTPIEAADPIRANESESELKAGPKREAEESPYFLEVWDVNARRRRFQFPTSSLPSALVFDKTGMLLATSNRQGIVTVWDMETGEAKHRIELPYVAEDLVFTPDGRRLAGATRTQTTIWDVASGHEITLRNRPRELDFAFNPRIVFSQDGQWLATSQWDATAWIRSSKAETPDHQGLRRSAAQTRGRAWTRDLGDVPIQIRGWWLEALPPIGAGIEANPNDFHLLARRARILERLGRHKEAQNDAKRMRELLGAGSALCLTGLGDHVEAAHIPFGEFEAFTIEAWIKNWVPNVNGTIVYAGGANEAGIRMGTRIGASYAARKEKRDYSYDTSSKFRFSELPPDQWNHLAMVFDGSHVSAWLNGQQTSKTPSLRPGPLNPARPFWIGRHPMPKYDGAGAIRAVRVSKVARYTGQFEPEQQLGADEDTVLLYDFTREDAKASEIEANTGKKNVVRDYSDRGNDGVLKNPWITE